MSSFLLEAPVRGLYFRYLGPTVAATLVTAVYLFADSVMVGHRLGADAISALNLIVPLEYFWFAVGALLGNGAAVCFTRSLSRGDTAAARRAVTLALAALLAFGVLGMLLSVLCLDTFVGSVLGARGALADAAAAYGFWIALGCPVFAAATFLQVLVRHDGAPRLAMAAVLGGGLSNILLDWIFLYPLDMGLGGAALATLLGALLTVLIMLPRFRSRGTALRFARPSLRGLPVILHYGCGAFLQDLSGCTTVLLFNRLILGALGPSGLVVYTVVANCHLTAAALFGGIAQAAIPIVAANAAVGRAARVRRLLSLALLTALSAGALFAAGGILFPEAVLRVFLPAGTVDALPDGAGAAVAAALGALLPIAAGQCLTLQLPALARPTAGLTMALLRNGGLQLPLALLLCLALAPEALWWAFALAELLLLPLLLRLTGLLRTGRAGSV